MFRTLQCFVVQWEIFHVGDYSPPVSSSREVRHKETQLLRRVLGRSMRNLRTQLEPKCSQEALAFIIGMDRSYVGAVERGEHDPRFSTLFSMTEGLNLGFADLGLEIDRQYRELRHKNKQSRRPGS